jgi:hypothetical protein
LTHCFTFIRTLRKDPHTKNGYVTLAVLVKIFQKYTLTMTEQVQREIYVKYRAPRAVAVPILRDLDSINASENLYVGLDQKVVPKMLTKSLKKELLTSAQQQAATLNQNQLSNNTSRLRKQSTLNNMYVICTLIDW